MRCQEREFDCILCVPPRQGCKKGTGGYNQISFIAKTTVNFRKRTLFPKPAVMIIPSLYSQVRSKQLQLKWHTGNSRLSLLVAPVQADNRTLFIATGAEFSLLHPDNSRLLFHWASHLVAWTGPFIVLLACDKWHCLCAKAMRVFLCSGRWVGAPHTTGDPAELI